MSAVQQTRPADWSADIGEPVIAIGGSPDATRWAVLGTEGRVNVLDATGRLQWECVAHAGGGFRLAWHPTLNLLATSGADGTTRLWDPTTGKQLQVCAAGSAWVEQLEWSPDGRYLATGAGRILTLWNVEGTAEQTWKNHRSTLAALCWRADGRKLAAACYGGVQIYDPALSQPDTLLPWKTSLLSLAWSPDQRWVVAGTQDLSVQIWPQPFRIGDELAMSGYAAKVRDLAWHHGSRYLATGGGEEIMVWDCGGDGPSGTTPRILAGHAGLITALKYQSRGHILASGGLDGFIRFWNAKNPEVLAEVRLPGEITTLAWARNNQTVLAGTREGAVALVTAPGG